MTDWHFYEPAQGHESGWSRWGFAADAFSIVE
jgi:hypothetical protein